MPPRDSGSRSTRSVRARPPHSSAHSKTSTSPTDVDNPSQLPASSRNRRVKEEPDDGTHLPEEKTGRGKRSKGKQKAAEPEEELVAPPEQETPAEGEGEEEETRCVCGRNGSSPLFFSRFVFHFSPDASLMPLLGSQMRTLV